MKHILTFWILLHNIALVSQNKSACHTQINTQALQTLQHYQAKLNKALVTDTNSYCIRLRFHLIRKSDHSGGCTASDVLRYMDTINKQFNPYNLSFSLSGINYIDSTYFYIHSILARQELFTTFQDTTDINIFISDSFSPLAPWQPSQGIGLANGFLFSFIPDSFNVDNTNAIYLSGKDSTYDFISAYLSHELGHVLGLFHTFETWFGKELVNGSNCSTTGDFVCDTHASPGLGGLCIYSSGEVDSLGDPYTPDPFNYMEYSGAFCRTLLTPGQVTRMKGFLNTVPQLKRTICSTPTPVKEQASANNIRIFPNPATNYIEIHGVDEPIEKIQILNSIGELVIQMNHINNPTIDISSHTERLYYLIIQTKKGQTHVNKYMRLASVN